MNIYTHIQKSHAHTNAERLSGILMPYRNSNNATPLLEQVLEQSEFQAFCNPKKAG